MLNPLVVYLFAVVIGFAIAFFTWDKDPSLAGLLFTAIIALVPIVNSKIKERIAPTLLSVKGFSLRWRNLVFYGAVIMFLSIQVVGIITGVIVASVGAVGGVSPETGLVRLISLVTLAFWGFPLFLICGRWMGRRSMLQLSIPKGIFGVIAASVLAPVASEILDLLTVAIVADTSISPGMRSSIEQFASKPLIVRVLDASIVSVFSILFSLFGYWRGRRQIIGAYMGYLLRKAPGKVRQTIVDLAYEETMQERNPQTSTVQ